VNDFSQLASFCDAAMEDDATTVRYVAHIKMHRAKADAT
jgi:hypothetical protein